MLAPRATRVVAWLAPPSAPSGLLAHYCFLISARIANLPMIFRTELAEQAVELTIRSSSNTFATVTIRDIYQDVRHSATMAT